MSEPIITVKNVSKVFEIPHEKVDTLKSRFLNPFKKVEKSNFNALDNINFTVKKGEFLGLIGKNGSGKSTMLKMLAGIYEPSSGSIEITGNIVPFLELGVGFNPELTGRENVYLNGTILGMTRKYMESKYKEIVEFSELEEFMELPIKNYSSGMKMRLAFSIAVQVKAEVYLLDEILSVGDSAFQEKSLNKMRELLSGGATVVFVSHSAGNVQEMCSRVIFLENGKKVFDGDVAKGLDKYQFSLLSKEDQEKMQAIKSGQSINESGKSKQKSKWIDEGDGRSVIKKIRILNCNNKKTINIKTKEDFKVVVEAEVLELIENPVISVSIRPNQNTFLYAMSTPRNSKRILKSLNKGDKIKITFNAKMQLNPGVYQLRVHIGDPKIHGKGKGGFSSLIQNASKVKVFDDEIKDPELWTWYEDPKDWSEYVDHEFSYDIEKT